MKIVVVVFLLVLIPLVSAEVQELGTFQSDTPVNLIQICSNCTFNNITSVILPNGSSVLNNVVMTQSGSIYNYTLSAAFTTLTGQYIVNGLGDDNGINTIWSYTFKINGIGRDVSTPQGILYFLIFFIGFIIFLATLGLAVYLPFNNKRDQMTGYVIAVENLKYLKIFCFYIAALMLIVVIYFGLAISRYLDLGFLVTLLRLAFVLSLAIGVATFIVGTFVLFANLVRDSNIKELLERGLRVS